MREERDRDAHREKRDRDRLQDITAPPPIIHSTHALLPYKPIIPHSSLHVPSDSARRFERHTSCIRHRHIAILSLF